jgi:hypothetical protein
MSVVKNEKDPGGQLPKTSTEAVQYVEDSRYVDEEAHPYRFTIYKFMAISVRPQSEQDLFTPDMQRSLTSTQIRESSSDTWQTHSTVNSQQLPTAASTPR